MKEQEFLDLCESRSASYINLSRLTAWNKDDTILSRSFVLNGELQHAFSMTKSFVGLVYVELLLSYDNFPQDIKLGSVPIFAKEIDKKGIENVRLVDLINHTSGLISGMSPGKFSFHDVLFFAGQPDLEAIMKNCIHEFKDPNPPPEHIRADYQHSSQLYDNYGSCFFAKLLEDHMRHQQIKMKQRPTWTIKQAAINMGVFEGLKKGVDYDWLMHPGLSVESYTSGFAGIKLDGPVAVVVANNILKKYKHVLEFIQGDKPNILYKSKHHTNTHRVKGDSTVAAANDGPQERQMYYSYGFWIPIIPGRRVITMIGMLGQFMAWDLDNDLIAVRMHYVSIEDIFQQKNRHKDFVWDAMHYMWDLLKL